MILSLQTMHLIPSSVPISCLLKPFLCAPKSVIGNQQKSPMSSLCPHCVNLIFPQNMGHPYSPLQQYNQESLEGDRCPPFSLLHSSNLSSEHHRRLLPCNCKHPMLQRGHSPVFQRPEHLSALLSLSPTTLLSHGDFNSHIIHHSLSYSPRGFTHTTFLSSDFHLILFSNLTLSWKPCFLFQSNQSHTRTVQYLSPGTILSFSPFTNAKLNTHLGALHVAHNVTGCSQGGPKIGICNEAQNSGCLGDSEKYIGCLHPNKSELGNGTHGAGPVRVVLHSHSFADNL